MTAAFSSSAPFEAIVPYRTDSRSQRLTSIQPTITLMGTMGTKLGDISSNPNTYISTSENAPNIMSKLTSTSPARCASRVMTFTSTPRRSSDKYDRSDFINAEIARDRMSYQNWDCIFAKYLCLRMWKACRNEIARKAIINNVDSPIGIPMFFIHMKITLQ